MIHTFELSRLLNKEIFEDLIETLKGLRYIDNIWVTREYREYGLPCICLYKFKPKDKRELENVPYTYMIVLSVNPNVILGGDGYLATDIRTFNFTFTRCISEHIFRLIPNLDEAALMKQELLFHFKETGNIWYFQRYEEYYEHLFKIRRIDYTFDLWHMEKEYISLINQGYVIRRNSYECCYYESRELSEEINDDELDEEVEALIDKELDEDKFQSHVKYIYYKSKSLNINIYLKGDQLKKDKLIDEDDNSYNFLRIEVQVKKAKLNAIKTKFDIPYRELHYMATQEVEKYVLEYYLQALTGKGHYVTLEEAKKIIDSNIENEFSKAKKEKLKKVVETVSARHSIAKMLELVENETIKELGKLSTVKKHLRDIHEKLNINPVTISTRMNVPKQEATASSIGEVIKFTMLPSLVDMVKWNNKLIEEERKKDEELLEEIENE